MKVIYCIGESLSEHEGGQSETVLNTQLSAVSNNFGSNQLTQKNILIAYEPVWAIGTGKTCSSETAQNQSVLIRNIIATLRDTFEAEYTTILYGGPLKPVNAAEYLAKSDINGGLVGGASLKPADFASLINVSGS